MDLLIRFEQYIVTPAIMVVFAAGFFLFVWGLTQFLWNVEDTSGRQAGIEHMKWGIIGMFVMVSVQGILMLLNTTFGLGIGPGGSYEPDTNWVGSFEVSL